MKKAVLLVIILFTLGIISCKKDKQEEEKKNEISINPGNGVFITHEGGFGKGEAKVSYYHITSDDYTDDLFKDANNQPLGDICQSMEVIDGMGYVVVNNSNKIEVVSLNTFISKGTISGLTSPRYICKVATNTAYVTDLYSNKVAVINLNNNTINSYININGWTEELLSYNGKAYITNPGTDKLQIVNTTTHSVVKTLTLTKGGSSIRKDKNNNIWVLCSGDYATSTIGKLYCISTANDSVIKQLSFASTADYPNKLRINNTLDTLYYINSSIYKLPISATAIPGTPFITSTGSFYGLAIRPSNNEIWVADAVDYIQKGKVYRYTQHKSLLKTLNVGVIPADFLFY